MKFIKNNCLRLLIWPFMVALALACLVLMKNAERDAMERLHPYLRVIRLREKEHEAFHAADRARMARLIREGQTNAVLFKQIRTNKPASRLTPAERKTLEELFRERLKPAIDRWANAYKGYIPFDVSEITLDKFYAVSNGNYMFMMGSATLTVVNSINGARVSGMTPKGGARKPNLVPGDGKSRDLSLPITREEVLPMAEADTGSHYELKDIVIKPTGAYGVIDGGAEVEVGIKYENGMMLVRPDDLSFTIGKDGKFITYQH